MREYSWSNPLRGELRNDRHFLLPKSKYPINCSIRLCQVPSLLVATTAPFKNQCFPRLNQQQTWKNRNEIQPFQAHENSPKNYRRSRICGHGSLKNGVQMHHIWHIIAWCPTPISILESVGALVVLAGTCGIWWLYSIIAPLVRTSDHWRCWWTSRVKKIELNL